MIHSITQGNQSGGDSLTPKQRQLLNHFNSMTEDAQAFVIALAENNARVFPAEPPEAARDRWRCGMGGLIQIAQRQLGAEAIETVNARELHAFLESRDDFSTWMKSRVEQYGFAEGIDYTTFQEKTGKGRPKIEYALSLDMAKELAMVERSEKGKRARQYFIECERAAKSQAAPAALARIDGAMNALKLAPLAVRAARALGLDKNVAAISANQYIRTVTGHNLLEGFGATHLPAERQDTQWFTPTELSPEAQISARKLNEALAAAGLQERRGKTWELTPAGHAYARLFDTGKKHNSGVMVQQIKWSPAVLQQLRHTGSLI